MSSSATAGGQEVEKSKDGVPRWTGDASLFVAYEEACYLYEASTEYYKRYMCAPRLILELSGAAKRMVAGRKADWVSKPNGVSILLDHLRHCLGRPQIPEMTEHLTRYFKSGRRKAHESMNDYITRKAEMYLRAQQAMKRVVDAREAKTREREDQRPGIGGAPAPGNPVTEPYTWGSGRRVSLDSTTDGSVGGDTVAEGE